MDPSEGLRVWVFWAPIGYRAWGDSLAFRVWGLGLRVPGLGLRWRSAGGL